MERDRSYKDINLWTAGSIADLEGGTNEIIDGYIDTLRSQNELYEGLRSLVLSKMTALKRLPTNWNPLIARSIISLQNVNHDTFREEADDLDNITVFDSTGQLRLRFPTTEEVFRLGPPNFNARLLRLTNWEHPHDLVVKGNHFMRGSELILWGAFAHPIGSQAVDHRRSQLDRLASVG
jgi:hypothetical protein